MLPRPGAFVQQRREMAVLGDVRGRVVEEATGGAAPRGEARQQVLANGVVIVVDGDPRAQDVLGERKAGFFVAFFVAALVPYVVVLRLVWKEKN